MMNCNHFRHNRRKNVPFILHKISSVSGAGIPGAVFELTACNGSSCSGTTDAGGQLLFCLLPCNSYLLQEVGTPAGYLPTDHVYHISVNTCGHVLVDGVPTSQLVIPNTPSSASFTAIKVSAETGLPLAGAVYALFMNAVQIATAVSGMAGQLTFVSLSPGVYDLVELTPPVGFLPNLAPLTLMVASNGTATINGLPADGFVIRDAPLREFLFRKTDGSTGLPLPGATFSLMQNGTVIGTALSGADGMVRFGPLAIGTYQMTELIPPAGYQPNTTAYQVVVAADGSITVNGTPLEAFFVQNFPLETSAPPVINTILEGDTSITGTGVPGAAIVVTLPNSATVAATVGPDGTWSVTVPAGVELLAGQVVSAVQTEPFKLPSSPTYSTVVGLIEPFLEKTYENLTSPGQPVQPGDTLRFTVLVGNLGGVGSVWSNVLLTDVLIEELVFAPGTVAIDGQLIPVGTGAGQYTYDGATRTLTIRVGDLTSGEVRTVTFQTEVGPDATAEIINSITALGLAVNAPAIAASSVTLK